MLRFTFLCFTFKIVRLRRLLLIYCLIWFSKIILPACVTLRVS